MAAEDARRRRAADAEGAARGAARPARRGRAAGARARLRRGRDLPPRRRAGARSRGDAGHDPARRARPPPARPPRPRPDRRRRRLPLPPPADPRRRLRRAPQGGPRRPARPLRRLARRARRTRSSSATRSSATTSSRPAATGRSSGSPTPASPNAPPRGSPPPAGARSTARTTGPEPRCSPGRPSSYDRTGLDLALELESAWAHGDSMRVRQQRRRKRSPNVPRPPVTSPGRCSRVRWPSMCAASAGEPDATDELIALCRAALPLEEERGDPRRLALLWELLAAAADFHMQNDDVVEASLQALRYQRLAGYSRSDTELEWCADHRPAAGRRGDADDGRARRLAAPGLPGPPAGGAARDARPLRRGVAARRGAVEPPARGDRQHLPGRLRIPRADRDDRRRPGARMPVHRRRDRAHRPRRHPGGDGQGAVSHATSATSVASTRPSDSSKRLGPSRRPVPAFG